MKLTAVAHALKAVTQQLSTSMSIQTKSTAMTTSVSSTKLAAEIGEFLLHMRKRDAVTVIDGSGVLSKAFLEFVKARADASLVDDSLVLALGKLFSDSTLLSESVGKALEKGSLDSAGVLQSHTVQTTKAVSSALASLDVALVSLLKATNETALLSDADLVAFFKALADEPVAFDQVAASFTKLAEDASAVTEQRQLGLTKTVDDRVFSSDDIDGAASIDDDQEVQFIKSVTEIVGVSDAIYIVIVLLRDFFDTSISSDLATLEIDKPVVDSSFITDHINTQAFKGLNDSALPSESVATVFAKLFTDNLPVSEIKTLALNAGKHESALISDTGLLRSQSYCDFSYLSEDYVGVSTSF